MTSIQHILSKGKLSPTSEICLPTPSNTNQLYHASLKALSDTLDVIHGTPTINEPEKKSIKALIAYVSYDKGIREETVRALTQQRFGVHDVLALHSRDFEDAVRFLVDFGVH